MIDQTFSDERTQTFSDERTQMFSDERTQTSSDKEDHAQTSSDREEKTAALGKGERGGEGISKRGITCLGNGIGTPLS